MNSLYQPSRNKTQIEDQENMQLSIDTLESRLRQSSVNYTNIMLEKVQKLELKNIGKEDRNRRYRERQAEKQRLDLESLNKKEQIKTKKLR